MKQGAGYSPLKGRSDGLAIVDPYLSKVLREAVDKQSTISKFSTEILRLDQGGKGNEYEVLMADDDPAPDVLQRTVQNDMDSLKETALSFSAHSYKSREYGISVKWNTGDIELSEIDLINYVKKFMARDVATTRDTLCLQELDLTPHRYIPFNDTDGVFSSYDSFANPDVGFAQVPQKPADYKLLVTADTTGAGSEPYIGKILPTQHLYYNSLLDQVADDYSATTKRALACSPLFVGYQQKETKTDGTVLGYALGVGPTADPTTWAKGQVDLSYIDPSRPGAFLNPTQYPIPKMNLAHLQNMISFALQNNILPFEKMPWGSTVASGFYVMMPSIQAANLLRSMLETGHLYNMGGFIPTSASDLSAVRISGVEFEVHGTTVPCRVVIDDRNLPNWFNIYGIGNTFPAWVKDAPPPAYQPFADSVATPQRSLWGAILDCSHVPVPKDDSASTATTLVARASVQKKSQAAICLGNRWYLPAGTDGPVCQIPVAFSAYGYLPQGYGPCYLVGKDSVQELVHQEVQMRKMDPQDFARLGGVGWVMRNAFKNPNVPTSSGQCTPGMPFSKTTNALAPGLKQYFVRTSVVKFDWPTWVAATPQTT